MSATPEQIAERLEALSKAAFGGDWTVCTEEFGPHKGAVYIHAHDVDADEDGLARDYGKRICDMADNDDDEANAELIAFIGNFSRTIVRAIRAQAERVRVLEEAATHLCAAIDNLWNHPDLRHVRADIPESIKINIAKGQMMTRAALAKATGAPE